MTHESAKEVSGTQGPVVRKPISTNPGLKVNLAFYFSYLKMFKKKISARDEDKSKSKLKAKKSLEKFYTDKAFNWIQNCR